MITTRHCGVFLFGCIAASVFADSCARAAELGASASVGTSYPCPSFCGGSANNRFRSSSDGGEGLSAASISFTNEDGFGTATATLSGSSFLPLLGVFADSNPLSRVTSQAVGLSAYHYTGTTPTTVDLQFTIEGSTTAAVPLDATISAAVAVIAGEDVPFYTSYGTFVFEVVPGSPDLTLLGNTQVFLPSNVANASADGSISMSLTPGEKFFVWASLSGSGVRDGIADASHTFTAHFSDATNIVPVATPEPSAGCLALLLATLVGNTRNWRRR